MEEELKEFRAKAIIKTDIGPRYRKEEDYYFTVKAKDREEAAIKARQACHNCPFDHVAVFQYIV